MSSLTREDLLEFLRKHHEGVADEPSGAELMELKETYFAVYPDGRDRQTWEGITYFRIRPTWIRCSDFSPNGQIAEFPASALRT